MNSALRSPPDRCCRGGSEFGEGRIDRTGVYRVSLYEEIDVFGETRLGVKDDRITADDQVFNAMGMEDG